MICGWNLAAFFFENRNREKEILSSACRIFKNMQGVSGSSGDERNREQIEEEEEEEEDDDEEED